MERREPELRLFDSDEELNSCLADYVCQISESSVRERGAFSIVLSGGDMPKRLGKLTRPPFLKSMELPKWLVFWAEENVVPKNIRIASTDKLRKLLSPRFSSNSLLTLNE